MPAKMETNGKGDPVILNVVPTETSLHMGKPAENGSAGSGRPRDKADDVDVEGAGGMAGKIVIKQQIKQCCSDTFTLDNILKKFPIVKWLPKYRCDTFQSDLIAGLTVGLTVIPQGLAYAQIADLPPQYGLYSAFMGCFVYCFLGTSKDITLGPTAIMSLMTAAFGTAKAPTIPGTDEKDPTMAIILTLMAGVVQFAMGVLKLGILVNYISYPVINAFTSAAAITIALGQVKNILGLKHIPNEFLEMVYETCEKIPETRVWDMTMGLVSLIVVILMKKLRQIKWSDEDDPDRSVPLPLVIVRKFIWLAGTAANAIVVIGAAGVVAIIESQGYNDTITVTGDIRAGMPPFQPPKFEITTEVNNATTTMSTSEIFSTLGAGLGIVPLLGLVENMAIGKAFARANNYKIDPTQELLAMGTANIISSFVSSYPITGSFSRTAVNSQSGVRTPMGGIWTGGLVILALCVLTPWFYYIPKSALAAVIIAAVIQMVDYKIVLTLWRSNKWDLIPLSITFICSLVVGIEYGILIGIGISLFMILYPIARPKIKYTTRQGLLIVTPMQGLNFPGSEYLEEKCLLKAMEAEKPRNIVLNMERMSDLDYTAVQSLKSLTCDCELHGMRLILANGSPRVNRLIKASNIKSLVLVNTLQEALDEFCLQDDGGAAIIEEEEPFMSRL